MEKVESLKGSVIIIINIKMPDVVYGFIFNSDEKLKFAFSFNDICSITNSDVIVNRESILFYLRSENMYKYWSQNRLVPIVKSIPLFWCPNVFPGLRKKQQHLIPQK